MIKINKELKKLIEENTLALATVSEQGQPHCIAVAFVKVVSDKQILVTDNYMVETRQNILRNSEVALVVWNKDWQKDCAGHSLKGKAKYFAKGKWHEAVRKIPENKSEPCKGAILVTIDKIKKLT